MPKINLVFTVVDKFAKAMYKYRDRLNDLVGASQHVDSAEQKMERTSNKTAQALEKTSAKADKSTKAFGGLGGAMLIANQAMQVFQRISGQVKSALEEIGDKQRAIIMLGQDAGDAFNTFAHDAARALGRADSEVRKAGLRWRETGIGGKEIQDMTKLADRLANLNPGKSFEDVANALNDAVKSHNTSGLADLLGGGQGVERKLQRAGVERKLRRGDVSGAMDAFKGVADGFGYTQERADKMGNTIDKKVDKITNMVKSRFTEMFSSIVSRAEPYIERISAWLSSEDAERFFDTVGSLISGLVDGVAWLVDKVSEGLGWLKDTVSGVWGDIVGDNVSFLDTVTGIVVGGAVQIAGSVYNAVVTGWNFILKFSENFINKVIDRAIGLRNSVVEIVHKLKTTVVSIIASLVESVLELANKLAGTSIGEKLGLDQAAKDLQSVVDSLHEIENSKPDLVDPKKHHVNYADDKMLTKVDSTQMAADAVGASIKAIHAFFNLDKKDGDADERKKNEQKKLKALNGIRTDTGKIRGAMTQEQDLRWMKEMAEQRFVNEVNVRQLTPTINLTVKGDGSKLEDVGRFLRDELVQLANAGTFGSYGEVG